MTPEEAARHIPVPDDEPEPETARVRWLMVAAFSLGAALTFGGVSWWVETIVRWMR